VRVRRTISSISARYVDEPVSGAVIGDAGAGLVVVARPIRAVAPNPRKYVNPDRDRPQQLDLLH
jgi:hypothetical protein